MLLRRLKIYYHPEHGGSIAILKVGVMTCHYTPWQPGTPRLVFCTDSL